MPSLMTADEAATGNIAGWGKSTFGIHFPKRFTLWMKTLCVLHYGAYSYIGSRLVKSEADAVKRKPHPMTPNTANIALQAPAEFLAVAQSVHFFEALQPTDVARTGKFYTAEAWFKDLLNEARRLAEVQCVSARKFGKLCAAAPIFISVAMA